MKRNLLPVLSLACLVLSWANLGSLVAEEKVESVRPKTVLPTAEEAQFQSLEIMLEAILSLDSAVEKNAEISDHQTVLLLGLTNLITGHNNILLSKASEVSHEEQAVLLEQSKKTSKLSRRALTLLKERSPGPIEE